VPHAGWYNDETDPTLARWFDGVAWTEHAVVKADWEAIGQPPPPPVELAAGAAPRSGRVRMAVGSAAVAAVLVVAGVALAQDGDDPPAKDRPTSQDRDGADGVDVDGLDELDGLGDTVADVPTDLADGSASGGGGAAGSSSASGSTTKTSTSSKKTTQAGTVTRTERRSESHVIPGTSEAVGSGDQTDVGNDSNKNIDIDYEPPPPPPPDEEPTTEDTPAPPPDGGTTGGTDPEGP
jgi:hypothetical protein